MNKVCDFTGAALERRLDDALRTHDYVNARVLTSVITMYERGIIQIEWEHGEPIMRLTEHGAKVSEQISECMEHAKLVDLEFD